MARNKRIISVVDSDGSIRKSEVDTPDKRMLDVAREMSYMSLGYYIATPIVIGVFAGWWLDRRLDTKPVLTLICICVGSIAAFYNLYKIIKDG